MRIYSQRDSRWANDFLGNNTSQPYTLGLYGCLVTCFSSYIGQTPNTVNQIIRDNGGFQSGGLFIWSKSTVLGLNQTYVSPRYDGIPVTSQGITKIKELLDQNLPLICEVDFNPNTDGEEMHFVLITRYEGDSFYAMDPWVGEIINLSVYGGAARAIIQFRAYDKKLETKPNISTPVVGNIPQYLTTLLQENKLDLNNEGQIREFFQKAIDFNGVKGNLENSMTQRAELKVELEKAQAEAEYLTSLNKISFDNGIELSNCKEKLADTEDALLECQTKLKTPTISTATASTTSPVKAYTTAVTNTNEPLSISQLWQALKDLFLK